MFDNVLQITAFFNSFSPGLHRAVRGHFTNIVEVAAWAQVLTATGAAYAKRMIPLRIMAMLGNVLGVAVGAGNLATFIKHAVNLPLNAARLREMRRLNANVREARETDLKIEWLKPFMHPRALKAGGLVFSKGDEASEAFVLDGGRILIPERSVALDPGFLFGEMALFTAVGRRTASAVCASEDRLLVITYKQFEQM